MRVGNGRRFQVEYRTGELRLCADESGRDNEVEDGEEAKEAEEGTAGAWQHEEFIIRGRICGKAGVAFGKCWGTMYRAPTAQMISRTSS